MKFLFAILIIFLFSCNAAKHINAPPSVERTVTTTLVPKDTTLGIKADTASIVAKLTADSNGKISIVGNNNSESDYYFVDYRPSQILPADKKANSKPVGRALQPSINIDDKNNLTVNCYCDSANIAFTYNEKTTIDKTIVKPPPIEIEKTFTGWQWVQLWSGRLFLILLLIIILLAIRKYIITRRY